MSAITIGFVGMTHLGVCLSTLMKKRAGDKANVICYDPSPNLIRQLDNEVLRIYEPEFYDIFKKQNIKFTDKPNLGDCNIIYITKDIDEHTQCPEVIKLIKFVSDNIDGDVPIVVVSQVVPDFCRSVSSLIPNPVYYHVDKFQFGNVSNQNVFDTIIIGSDTNFIDDDILDEVHDILGAKQVFIVSYEEAELAKLAVNAYLAAQLSITNALSDLASEHKVNWQKVRNLLLQDRRIGTYTRPSLNIGGDHFLRDIVTLAKSSKVAKAVYQSFKDRTKLMKDFLRAFSLKNETICVLGVTYKEDTNVTKGSPAEFLFENLVDIDTNIQFYDPVIDLFKSPKIEQFGASSVYAAMDGATVMLILAPWDEFKSLKLEKVWRKMKKDEDGKVHIFDPFNCIDVTSDWKQFIMTYGLGA